MRFNNSVVRKPLREIRVIVLRRLLWFLRLTTKTKSLVATCNSNEAQMTTQALSPFSVEDVSSTPTS